MLILFSVICLCVLYHNRNTITISSISPLQLSDITRKQWILYIFISPAFHEHFHVWFTKCVYTYPPRFRLHAYIINKSGMAPGTCAVNICHFGYILTNCSVANFTQNFEHAHSTSWSRCSATLNLSFLAVRGRSVFNTITHFYMLYILYRVIRINTGLGHCQCYFWFYFVINMFRNV